MPITRTPIINDDGTCTTGTVWDNAWKQEFYDQIDALAGGPWVDVPYGAQNFGGVGIQWTVGAGNVIGNLAAVDRARKLVTIQQYIVASVLAAGATALNLVLPTNIGGYAIGPPVRQSVTPCVYQLTDVDANLRTGFIYTQPGVGYAQFLAAWVAAPLPASNGFNLAYTLTFPIA